MSHCDWRSWSLERGAATMPFAGFYRLFDAMRCAAGGLDLEPAGASMRSLTRLLSTAVWRDSLRLSLNFRRMRPLTSELFDVCFQGPADL